VRAIQRFRNVNLWPLLAPPAFSRGSGYFTNNLALGISQTNSAGTIWFTLDGRDPRSATGAPSGTARSYSAPISLTNSTRVLARVTDGTNWSPPADATYLPLQALTNLMVTELYYNPPAAANADGEAFEFIELQNRGAFALDLTGVRFTAGFSFIFTNGATLGAGAFLVLARDSTNYAARFPGAPLHGLYSGKLDNHGERLTMEDALGGVIFSFAYQEAAPWPITADGFGDSLQRITFLTSPTNASQWIGATPTPGSASPLLDRDGDGLPDVWEILYGLDGTDPTGDDGANGDPDHDGVTNLEEYIAGTAPTNPLSVLKFDRITVNSGVSLTFLASSNKTYTIQSAPSLAAGAWSNFIHFGSRPTNHLEAISDSTRDTSRFYRIVTPRQP
jgi:Lamin Tail Domain/Chitobiase/beta-hexosaminidase C-terminal domain